MAIDRFVGWPYRIYRLLVSYGVRCALWLYAVVQIETFWANSLGLSPRLSVGCSA